MKLKIFGNGCKIILGELMNVIFWNQSDNAEVLDTYKRYLVAFKKLKRVDDVNPFIYF